MNEPETIAIIGLFGPSVTNAVQQIVGPTAQDLGTFIRDNVHSLGMKVSRILKEKKAETHPVSPAIGIPLLRHAVLQDDEDMQELWAQLLATAATDSNSIHPGFAEVLKQLTPDEARKLSHLYDVTAQPSNQVHFDESLQSYAKWRPALDSFQRHWLLTLDMNTFTPSSDYTSLVYEYKPLQRISTFPGPIMRVYTFTQFGIAFMRACTGKEPGTTPRKPYIS